VNGRDRAELRAAADTPLVRSSVATGSKAFIC
jgi:hypothetical protein